MKWKTSIQLGRVTYNLELPRNIGELTEAYLDPAWVPTYPLATMVDWDSSVGRHNDKFVLQTNTDPLTTIGNSRDGITWMTACEIDIRDMLLEGRLITLDNINIQRQHGAPWSGLTYNIDEGGMIDEYIILTRAPLIDNNLPANGVPKLLPSQLGLRAGFDIGDMQDIILCERRRYQPDARFVATQPQTAATTYGDLGSPPEDPGEAGTRRFVSFSVSDVETWGDTNAPINGPTIYCYRYVQMYAAQRQVQRFGSSFSYAQADNLAYLQMHLNVIFPAIHITMSGDAPEANLGELAVAYEKKLLQRGRLERSIIRGRPYGQTNESQHGGGDHTADESRENPDPLPDDLA